MPRGKTMQLRRWQFAEYAIQHAYEALNELGGMSEEDMRVAVAWCDRELNAIEAQVPEIDLPGDTAE
jgi:hypothetical protein